ncbi:biotin-dependent carboxyltransferase family protein [Marinobacter daepoensis]|uniref:Biotin-dependent carboxyltransferase family protein n=1 Tax=Marinobacter daepoensis TaxID=262077 RepID=A0ABS3B8X0_9GAMM|nr:biotin-dependent carboxyltransferase family protein [Marinobacter daepoensis]MBN7768304.1 biotin-dependent carboxyltransferase family protein [Marinobacter daepoensis]MBY6034445.1 biotin-dependent carboxyltransferase family protein [Marinobacter daepoensis]MBY6080605.1 biotin-dependent carboxyltransferase family protein [Marinobacter daepoensis]
MTPQSATDIAIRVRRAGPLALLQDRGRFGVRHLGVTQGGPADLYSWAWANHLAGNPWGSASLEVTFGGLQLVAERDLEIAIAGADLGATLEGKPVPLWQRVHWPEGQTLAFGTPASGLRAYLSVHGGFAAPPAMGSVACVAREQLGGFDGYGRKLADDDQLRIFTPTTPTTQGLTEAPGHARPDFREPPQLDLLPGAQIAEFTGRSLFDAFNAWWRVDDRADRMGVRLTGPRLQCQIRSLISEGINLGGVQVPPDGQPIVLLNDRQTIGGYPRLGSLSPLAASRLAQCLPGQEVRLVARSSEAVLREYRAFLAGFNA